MKCPQCGAPLPGGALAGLCPACLLKQASADSGTQPEGKNFEPPLIPELQRLFPQLEILAMLGKGGMGAVYKARQPKLERLVALKILPSGAGTDPGFAERFTREAQALARLTHPNIIALHEFGQVDGFHYFLMEFVDGINLRQLQKAHRVSPREALQIIPQMCDALQYAHDQGVVHRDIKPENVLLDRKGHVKIADFGLAKMLGREPENLRLTREGQVMGTPNYMAPEQVEHPLEVDHRADIYSLGVVFYEILTGELPLGKFPPPSRKVEVDVRLDEVVLHALEKDPNRRYQQASQVKTEVQNITATPGATGPVPLPAPVAAGVAGVEYKSKLRLLGLPLLHIATGLDPLTGRRRVATGVIAIGNIARGGIALGGVALGGVAVGGLSLGFLSFGGLSLGLLAIGGLAIGFGALGGGAIGAAAIGGAALGHYANGGGAWGSHTVSALGADPLAWDFFEPWARRVMQYVFGSVLWLAGVAILLTGLLPIWLQRRDTAARSSPRYWANALVALICAGLCLGIALWNPSLLNLPQLNLVSGTVRDALTGKPLPGARVEALGGPGQHRLREAATRRDGGYSFVVPSATRLLLATAPNYNTNAATLELIHWGAKRHARIELKLEKEKPASAQIWSPPAGESPDPKQVLEEGRDLMRRHEYEEALQHFIWYMNHLDENGNTSLAVGAISVMSDWIELGRRYPKAKQALLEIRDRIADHFARNEGYFDLFSELTFINQYLQQQEATYQLFKSIEQKDATLAAQCFGTVQSLLVQRGEYQNCLKYLGDWESAFERICRNREMLKQSEDRWDEFAARVQETTKANPPTVKLPAYRPVGPPKTADKRFVDQSCELIEILVGAGHKTDAEKVCEQALAVLDEPRLKSAVADAEKKINARKS